MNTDADRTYERHESAKIRNIRFNERFDAYSSWLRKPKRYYRMLAGAQFKASKESLVTSFTESQTFQYGRSKCHNDKPLCPVVKQCKPKKKKKNCKAACTPPVIVVPSKCCCRKKRKPKKCPCHTPIVEFGKCRSGENINSSKCPSCASLASPAPCSYSCQKPKVESRKCRSGENIKCSKCPSCAGPASPAPCPYSCQKPIVEFRNCRSGENINSSKCPSCASLASPAPCSYSCRKPKVESRKCRSGENIKCSKCPSCAGPATPAPCPYSCQKPKVESRKCRSGENIKCSKCPSCVSLACSAPPSRTCVSQAPHCTQCDKIPLITQELCSLKKKLEQQIGEEVKQKQQLNSINDQLKKLCENFRTLNDRCKCCEKRDAKEECKCSCDKKVPPTNACCLQPKISSMCQFCKNKKMSIINNFPLELFKLMGKRCFDDIALSILLRSDNIYHVNVRELCTGCSLGCMLVSDSGIKAANCMGLFKEILTFCVIDVRNSLKNQDSLCGCVNFEFICHERMAAGCSRPQGQQAMEMEFISKESVDSDENTEDTGTENSIGSNSEMSLTLTGNSKSEEESKSSADLSSDAESTLRANTKEILKRKLTIAEVLREIRAYSSNLVLTDTETKHPVRDIRIASIVEYSSPSEYILESETELSKK